MRQTFISFSAACAAIVAGAAFGTAAASSAAARQDPSSPSPNGAVSILSFGDEEGDPVENEAADGLVTDPEAEPAPEESPEELAATPSGSGAADAEAKESLPGSESDSRPLGRDAGLLQMGEGGNTADEEPPSILSKAGLSEEAVRVGGSLAAVIGLLVLLAMGARRFGAGFRAGRPGGVLEILARYPIGRRQHLILLKLDRRILLVHQSGAAMTTLTEVSDPRDVASLLARVEAGSRDGIAGRFQKALQSATRQHDDRHGIIETIDLTRSQGRALRTLRKRAAA